MAFGAINKDSFFTHDKKYLADKTPKQKAKYIRRTQSTSFITNFNNAILSHFATMVALNKFLSV